MTKPLDGVRIIDFTHVQAGPACTQLLGFYGADVIKVERPGSGDVTRSQLRDIPGADALYFTMLNGNKRSLTLDTKTAEGKEVLEKMIRPRMYWSKTSVPERWIEWASAGSAFKR